MSDVGRHGPAYVSLVHATASRMTWGLRRSRVCVAQCSVFCDVSQIGSLPGTRTSWHHLSCQHLVPMHLQDLAIMYADPRDTVIAGHAEEPIGNTNRATELMQLLGHLPTFCPVRTCSQEHSYTLLCDPTEVVMPHTCWTCPVVMCALANNAMHGARLMISLAAAV